MFGLKSDEKLMLQYQQGDCKAFEKLYSRHKQKLFRFMLGICSDRAVVEELFQDVWMKLIDAKARYEADAKFTTYLFQIARNRVIDHYRKHSTQSEFNTLEMNHLIENCLEHEFGSPELLAEAEQTHSVIHTLIKQLPYEQREVFLLKENSDLSINEIAELINEKSETVKSRLRYALKKIQSGLENNG